MFIFLRSHDVNLHICQASVKILYAGVIEHMQKHNAFW